MKRLKIALLGLIIFAGFSRAYAMGTTACNFFKIGAGARSGGMGETFLAVADDIDAIYYNPSGIAHINKDEFSLMHINWLFDTKYEYLAHIYTSKWHKGRFGFSVIYLYNDKIKYTLNSPEWDGRYFKFYNLGLFLSYGIRIGKIFSIGGNLKLFQEGITGAERYTSKINPMIDIGALLKLKKRPLNLAFCIQNLGPKAKYKYECIELPLTFKLGISYRFFRERLILALDLSKPKESKFSFNIGSELKLFNFLYLRAGYIKGISNLNKNFSLGLGFKLKNYYLDFAYTPYEDLNDVLRASLTVKGSFSEPWEKWREKRKIKKMKKIRDSLLKIEKELLFEESKEEREDDEEEIDRWRELEEKFLRKYEEVWEEE
jgi:hypothetical protein